MWYASNDERLSLGVVPEYLIGHAIHGTGATIRMTQAVFNRGRRDGEKVSVVKTGARLLRTRRKDFPDIAAAPV